MTTPKLTQEQRMSQRMLGDIAIDVAVEMPIDDGSRPRC